MIGSYIDITMYSFPEKAWGKSCFRINIVSVGDLVHVYADKLPENKVQLHFFFIVTQLFNPIEYYRINVDLYIDSQSF